MSRWVEAQSPAGMLRVVNIDAAAKIDFVFLEGNSVPFLARVYTTSDIEFDQVLEPKAEHLYAYLHHAEQQVPGTAWIVQEAPVSANANLATRIASEAG